jgi:hypothetical protein
MSDATESKPFKCVLIFEAPQCDFICHKYVQVLVGAFVYYQHTNFLILAKHKQRWR